MSPPEAGTVSPCGICLRGTRRQYPLVGYVSARGGDGIPWCSACEMAGPWWGRL